jgi:hypothetical protein
MGPPRSRGGPRWTGRPILEGPPLPSRAAGPPGAADPPGSPTAEARTASARFGRGLSALDDLRSAAAPPDEPLCSPGSSKRRPDPLREVAPGRARAPRREEARQDPSGRRVADARAQHRGSPGQAPGGGLRIPARRRGRSLPGCLCRGPSRRAGRDLRQVPGPGGRLLRRARRADRAGDDQQRHELRPLGGLRGDHGRPGDHPRPDPAVPTPGQTARWSDATGPWPRSGPTAGSTGPTPSAFGPWIAGSSSTIADGPTPRLEAGRRSAGCE